jgi:hypothetical protein
MVLPREHGVSPAIDGNGLEFELEAPIGAFSARFLEHGWKGDGEALLPCPARVFAGDAIEPTLPAAGDREIRRVDREADTPAVVAATARAVARVVFPTPPFGLMMASVFMTV